MTTLRRWLLRQFLLVGVLPVLVGAALWQAHRAWRAFPSGSEVIAVVLVTVAVVLGLAIHTTETLQRWIDPFERRLKAIARGNFATFQAMGGVLEFRRLADSLQEVAEQFEQKFEELGQLNEALVVQNEDSKRHVALLSALEEVGRCLINRTDLEGLMRDAFRTILRVHDMETGALYLLEGHALQLRIAAGLSPEGYQKARMAPWAQVSTTAQNRQVVVLENIQANPRTEHAAFRHEGLDAMICLPLVTGEQLIGVLTLGTRKPGHFTTREVSQLLTIANHLALALQNARLFEQTIRTNSQLEAVLHSMSEGLLVADREGRIVLANSCVYGFFRLADSLYGHLLPTFAALIADQVPDPSVVQAFFTKAQSHPGETHRTLLELHHPSLRYLQCTTAPVLDERNAVIGLVLVFHDLTPEKETERVLAETHGRLTAIFESLPQPIYVTDHQANVVAANPAFELLYGKTAPLPARCLWEESQASLTNALAVAPIIHSLLQDHAQGGFDVAYELEFRHPHRIYQVLSKALFDGQQRFTGRVTVYQDVTAERETTRLQADFIDELERLVADRTHTLAQKDQLMSSLYLVLEEFRHAHTPEELHDLIPREFCRYLGFQQAIFYRPSGQDLEAVAWWGEPVPQSSTRMALSDRLLRSDQSISLSPEDPVPDWPGKQWYAVSLKPRGDLLGTLYFSRNHQVTEDDLELAHIFANMAGFALLNAQMYGALETHNHQLEATVEQLKAAYEDLQAAQAQIIQSEKMASIGQVAAGVAHEIKNRFNVINMASYFIQMQYGDHMDDRVRASIGRIKQEIERGSKMITDLLQLARPVEPKMEVTPVRQILEEALAISPHPHLDTVMDVPADLPPILGDRSQLQQVLMNLILNAAQAMPEGGTLVLRGETDGDRVVIKIIDTGVGIAPEHLEKLFMPFFTTKRQGTGLGLGISRAIVHQHGGEIEVHSELGKGTTFTLRFPRCTSLLAPALPHVL